MDTTDLHCPQHNFFSSDSIWPLSSGTELTGVAFKMADFLLASWRGRAGQKYCTKNNCCLTFMTLHANPVLVGLQHAQLPSHQCELVNAAPPEGKRVLSYCVISAQRRR